MKYTDGYISDLREAASDMRLAIPDGSSILVTGASGLIGSALADVLLMRNAELDGRVFVSLAGRSSGRIKRRFSHWGENAYSFVAYDALSSLRLREKYEFIVHCAANAHPGAYVNEPVETAWGIVNGAHGMLESIRNQGSGKLLFVSSSEVYGQRNGMKPYGEGDFSYVDVTNPRSCYPSAKRLAETLCASYVTEYGVDAVIARPGHIYGPQITAADTRAHAQFARDAAAGHAIVMKSDGSQLRSYTYSLDCATALITILLQGEQGEAYNISNRNSIVTVRELAETLAKAGNVDIRFEKPVGHEAAGYNPMSCSALDSTKIESLGWTGGFDLMRGARATVDALRGGVS